jgi:acetyl-CoA C-acetyltransferase
METLKNVVILSGVRTPIGDFGGALRNEPPTRLGALVAAEAIGRAGLAPDQVGHAVFGSVVQTEPRDAYLARVAAVEAGVPVTSPAMTVNRLCGSGLQAIVSAAQMIRLGDVETALAGGAECMSRAGYLLPAARWGQRLGDAAALDMLLGALNDPFGNGHMGVTAENLARKHKIDRETQDQLAVESHRRAARAITEGRFQSQIVGVEVKDGKGTRSFDTDEHVRADVTAEALAQLRPAFLKDGTVTAGNASGINDGAGALILMEASAAERRGLTPLARIVAYAHAGVEPAEMGIGPVPAVRRVLERAGLGVGDLDVIESNEAFAAQACAVAAALGLPPERTNPNGGAIALGHPVGASGAIITVKLVHELHRIRGRYGLATMCIGGGQGIALVIERL